MATMYRIGEQLMKLYGQKMVGSKITRQEALLVAGQAVNKALRDLIWRNKAEEENLTIPYACFREYRLPIDKDPLRNKWYATLPIRTLESLAYNQGIYHVAPADDIDELMVPVSVGFNPMFKNLDSYYLEGRLSYYPERDRIYIQGADFEDDFEVFVRLIPDATSLEADDQMPAPADMEVVILQTALQLLGVQAQSTEDVNTDGI